MPMLRVLSLAAALGLAGGVALAQDGATKGVVIHDYAFAPATLTVAKGTRVTWVNRDDSPHTVTASDKQFRSPASDTDDTFAHTFDQPGRFAYFCTLHPQMVGTVEVLP